MMAVLSRQMWQQGRRKLVCWWSLAVCGAQDAAQDKGGFAVSSGVLRGPCTDSLALEMERPVLIHNSPWSFAVY